MEIRSLDWDRLKIFQAVAENGSISSAAAKLAVSTAKISRDVEELEHSIGQKLFERSPRGMELTDAGAVVLKSARSMSDSAHAISTWVKEVAVDQVCKVSIAAGDAIATYWLARKLPEFHRSNPNFEVMLKVVNDTPNVAAGEADISIQYEEPTTPNVISRQLGWLHYILYASPAYLSIHGTPQTMYDLGKHRFLLHASYNKQVELWDPKTEAWVKILPHAMTSNSSTVMVESCAQDGGVSPMPSYVSDFEPRLQAITTIPPLASIKFWLVYSEKIRNQPQYEPILAWLRSCFDHELYPCFREAYVAPPNGTRGKAKA